MGNSWSPPEYITSIHDLWSSYSFVFIWSKCYPLSTLWHAILQTHVGSILRKLLYLTHFHQREGLWWHRKCEKNEFKNKKGCVLTYWDAPSHRGHTLIIFSAPSHFHKPRSNYPSFKRGKLFFYTTLLLHRKLTPLKATFFRIPNVFYLHILYDGCTLTPTAWSRDNPVGDS